MPRAATLTEGFSADGQIGLLHQIRTPSGSMRAVIRAELRFASVSSAIGAEAWSPRPGVDSGLMLIAQEAWPVAWSTNVHAQTGRALVAAINKAGAGEGRVEGHRYVARPLEGGIEWARPAWIVGVRRESAWPAAIYGPFLLALVLGAEAVAGIHYLAHVVGRRLFFAPMVESAEAGLWVLRRAFGPESRTEQFMRKHPWMHVALTANAPIHAELEKWLRSVQAEAQAEVSELTVAIRHDLELATEFQQAFMKRPMPEIPVNHVEGRLRLEFFHAYQPALALGGDFFDIEAVGPDCAGVFVSDVMGHGTRSALLTSIIRTLLNKLYREGRNPPYLLRELNRSLCGLLNVLPQQFFASASYFTADTTARIATYSLAGHPPPFHVHRVIGRVTRLEKPRPRGAALGVIPDEEFGAESVRLVDGDLFVFYTDGAYEATNPAG